MSISQMPGADGPISWQQRRGVSTLRCRFFKRGAHSTSTDAREYTRLDLEGRIRTFSDLLWGIRLITLSRRVDRGTGSACTKVTPGNHPRRFRFPAILKRWDLCAPVLCRGRLINTHSPP